MKGKLRKIMSLMLAAVVAFGMIGIGTGSAYAATHKWTVYVGPMFVGNEGYVSVYDQSSSKYTDATVVDIKSSAPKVLKVLKDKGDNGTVYFTLLGKKVGKAKLTIKYKTPSGKYGTKKKVVRVKAYPKMIKSLKVNGNKVTVSKKTNSYRYTKTGYKKSSITVKIVPADGWKITSTYGYMYKYDPWKNKAIKFTKAMAKGKEAVSFSKKYDALDLYVTLENKETGDYVDYNISLDRQSLE